jgi:hypothetical protein
MTAVNQDSEPLAQLVPPTRIMIDVRVDGERWYSVTRLGVPER